MSIDAGCRGHLGRKVNSILVNLLLIHESYIKHLISLTFKSLLWNQDSKVGLSVEGALSQMFILRDIF